MTPRCWPASTTALHTHESLSLLLCKTHACQKNKASTNCGCVCVYSRCHDYTFFDEDKLVSCLIIIIFLAISTGSVQFWCWRLTSLVLASSRWIATYIDSRNRITWTFFFFFFGELFTAAAFFISDVKIDKRFLRNGRVSNIHERYNTTELDTYVQYVDNIVYTKQVLLHIYIGVHDLLAERHIW